MSFTKKTIIILLIFPWIMFNNIVKCEDYVAMPLVNNQEYYEMTDELSTKKNNYKETMKNLLLTTNCCGASLIFYKTMINPVIDEIKDSSKDNKIQEQNQLILMDDSGYLDVEILTQENSLFFNDISSYRNEYNGIFVVFGKYKNEDNQIMYLIDFVQSIELSDDQGKHDQSMLHTDINRRNIIDQMIKQCKKNPNTENLQRKKSFLKSINNNSESIQQTFNLALENKVFCHLTKKNFNIILEKIEESNRQFQLKKVICKKRMEIKKLEDLLDYLCLDLSQYSSADLYQYLYNKRLDNDEIKKLLYQNLYLCKCYRKYINICDESIKDQAKQWITITKQKNLLIKNLQQLILEKNNLSINNHNEEINKQISKIEAAIEKIIIKIVSLHKLTKELDKFSPSFNNYLSIKAFQKRKLTNDKVMEIEILESQYEKSINEFYCDYCDYRRSKKELKYINQIEDLKRLITQGDIQYNQRIKEKQKDYQQLEDQYKFINQMQAENDKLRAENLLQKKEIEHLDKNCHDNRQKIDQLEKITSEQDQEKIEINRQYNALEINYQKAVNDYQDRNKKYTKKYQLIEQENIELKKENEQLIVNNIGLISDNEAIKESVYEKQQLSLQLEQRNKDYEEKYKQLTTQNQKLQDENEILRSQIKPKGIDYKKSDQYKQLTEDNANILQEKQKLQQELVDYVKINKDLEQKNEDLINQKKIIEDKIKKTEDTVKNITIESNELKKKNKEIESEFTDAIEFLESEKIELETHNKKLQEENKTLKSQIKEKVIDFEDTYEYKKLNEEKNNALDAIKIFTTRLFDYKNINQELKEKNQELETINQELKNEIQLINLQLIEMSPYVQTINEEIKSIKEKEIKMNESLKKNEEEIQQQVIFSQKMQKRLYNDQQDVQPFSANDDLSFLKKELEKTKNLLAEQQKEMEKSIKAHSNITSEHQRKIRELSENNAQLRQELDPLKEKYLKQLNINNTLQKIVNGKILMDN